jgi:hypothetical protein
MAINEDAYGNVAEATDYFATRLHEHAWTGAIPTDRPKALIAATRIIDYLNFKGEKAAVCTLLTDNACNAIDASSALAEGCVTKAELQAASLSQPLEFPRGTDTEVPEDIRRACYEIAHSLLDNKDPELELENLGITSHGFASVRTSYSRSHIPIEHLINMVPNAMAWRILKPFINDDDAVKLRRVS